MNRRVERARRVARGAMAGARTRGKAGETGRW
jgi:hypothetical protein